MLELSAGLPELELATGEVLIEEDGDGSGPIWVLVSGALEVRTADVAHATITQPGAVIGEVSVLLGSRSTATVVATEPTRLRCADDGWALLTGDPRVLLHVATGLAGRLHSVNTYLADLKAQYGEAPGLTMVSDVLGHLTDEPTPNVRPGSARDPDPEY